MIGADPEIPERIVPDRIGVKVPQFSFNRLAGADPTLGKTGLRRVAWTLPGLRRVAWTLPSLRRVAWTLPRCTPLHLLTVCIFRRGHDLHR